MLSLGKCTDYPQAHEFQPNGKEKCFLEKILSPFYGRGSVEDWKISEAEPDCIDLSGRF